MKDTLELPALTELQAQMLLCLSIFSMNVAACGVFFRPLKNLEDLWNFKTYVHRDD